ncbi:hypothetical protein M407DRAFT_242870 [Tulasnella calospora MUT 4182]|uniref:Uncharacterized protein n=1 Tax=Tulasnella calospora MUT 4182 TaxID=1051891 RepID=A0A0C3L4T5_9AGAM|nr:hypothetical protein M407DRAFT_242870 [Tulasnella calospora MUT 4182]
MDLCEMGFKRYTGIRGRRNSDNGGEKDPNVFKEELVSQLGTLEYTRLAGLAQDDSQESAARDGAIVSTTGKLGPTTGGAV